MLSFPPVTILYGRISKCSVPGNFCCFSLATRLSCKEMLERVPVAHRGRAATTSKSGTQPQRGGPMAAQAIGLGRSPSAEPSQPQRGGPTATQAIDLG